MGQVVGGFFRVVVLNFFVVFLKSTTFILVYGQYLFSVFRDCPSHPQRLGDFLTAGFTFFVLGFQQFWLLFFFLSMH